MLSKLAAAFENGPADALVPLAQNAFELAQNVIAIGYAATRPLPNYLFHGFQKELFRQDHVGAVGLTPHRVGARSHAREALISRDYPSVHRRSLRAPSQGLENPRAGRRRQAAIRD